MKRILKGLLVVLLLATAVQAAEINDLSTTDASNTARFPESMAPSAVNNAARALEGLIARWFKDQNGSLVSTGSVNNTYNVSANQTISAYYDGLKIVFEAHRTNSAGVLLNVDSVGAATLYKHGRVELDAADIAAGQKYEVIHDGSFWNLVTPVSPTTGSITSGNIPQFYGTTGKFTDSGYSVSTIGTSSILTTQGDILYRNASTVTRLAASTTGYFLKTQGSGQNPTWDTQRIIQVVRAATTGATTGTTQIPFDDTIPQNTEGNEFHTCSITPTSATNKLLIEFDVMVASSVAAQISGAIFQDSTADALTASTFGSTAIAIPVMMNLRHYMTAGTTSSTTFKFRAGTNTAATLTLNGTAGGRLFGGRAGTLCTITEIAT